MKWKKTKFPGIRYRTHPTRKHGVERDRYYAIRYQLGGTRREEGLGWASEGWTIEKALGELAELKKNYRLGDDKPHSLEEKRKREEERRKAEAEKQKKADRDQMILGDFFKTHYLPFCEISKNQGILKRTSQHFKTWIKPSLGKYPLKDIRLLHVERLKKTMFDANKAPRTVQYVLASLRQVWNFARREGFVTGDSPTLQAMPKFDNRRMRFLTHEEADALLKEMKKKDLQAYQMALLSLHTGMRAGEILSLKWSCVDIDKGQILIMDSKSGRNRTVFMTDEVKRLFESMKQGTNDSYVFPSTQGRPLVQTPKAIDEAVKTLGLNQGITDRRQKVTFHSFRHSFASWLVQDGTDLYIVKELLGHSTLIMTQRYSHLAPGTLQAAVKRFEKTTKLRKKPRTLQVIK